MNGALLVGVKGIGTTEDDKLAFVNCEFQPGGMRAIAFNSDIGPALCSAFLTATGHLQKKQAMRGEAYAPVAVEITDSSVDQMADADQRPFLLLTFATKSGAELRFRLSPGAADKLQAQLNSPNSQTPDSSPPQGTH